MMTSFEVSVPYRCPFEYGPVPPLMAFRRFGLASGIKPLRNLSKFTVKVWCRRFHFPLRGSFGLHLDGQVKRINVSSHNSHFETVLAWPLGSYEPAVGAIIDMLLPQQGTFFDIGANWGYYSLFVAAREGFAGDIHAFEPYPPTVRDFEEVVRQAGFSDRIHLHRKALSDREGEAIMNVPHRVRAAEARLTNDEAGTSVPVCRLDSMDLPAPDFIKLDVESHEARFFSGAEGVLTRSKPVVIFENWAPPQDPERNIRALKLLEAMGFRLFAPELVSVDRNTDTRLRLTEVDSNTRKEFQNVVDICAVHRDRMGILSSSLQN